MKTIIACTDFTPSSVNACRYAALLAGKLKCKLTVFNLFEAPVVHSNTGLYGISFAAQKTISQEKTIKLIDKLQEEFPGISINYFITGGSFDNALQDFTTQHNVEAAVLGLKAKSAFSRFIQGSHGVSLVRKINTPVIIVPESFKEHKLSRILIAVDNNEKLYKSSLNKLEEFAGASKAVVKPLYVRTEDELFKPMQQNLVVNGEKKTIKTIEARNIQEGIQKYTRSNKIDMVAILSKDHSVFYTLFSETNTKKIAFAVKVPVMAIHE